MYTPRPAGRGYSVRAAASAARHHKAPDARSATSRGYASAAPQRSANSAAHAAPTAAKAITRDGCRGSGSAVGDGDSSGTVSGDDIDGAGRTPSLSLIGDPSPSDATDSTPKSEWPLWSNDCRSNDEHDPYLRIEYLSFSSRKPKIVLRSSVIAGQSLLAGGAGGLGFRAGETSPVSEKVLCLGGDLTPSFEDSKGPMPSGPRNDAPLVSNPDYSVVFRPSSVATSLK